jgi:hypothetical protein
LTTRQHGSEILFEQNRLCSPQFGYSNSLDKSKMPCILGTSQSDIFDNILK